MKKTTEIEKLLKEILEKMGILAEKIGINEDKPSTLKSDEGISTWISIKTEENNKLLDNKGEGLSALNHLIRKIFESKNTEEGEGENFEIFIDVNGFQKRRVESIHSLAHMMAERARYFESSIEMEPMPAFERRLVHEFLSNATDLKTESEGEGYKRRVVIKYIGKI